MAARFESVGRLADVATAATRRNLSFQSYVLGAFLDDVLPPPPQRLRLMTKSRYAPGAHRGTSGRKQAAGLGLLAYDGWTGASRPVATLSGGEKFMAALSLALGLAEVVQAHAGGIRLETVFVDEGSAPWTTSRSTLPSQPSRASTRAAGWSASSLTSASCASASTPASRSPRARGAARPLRRALRRARGGASAADLMPD